MLPHLRIAFSSKEAQNVQTYFIFLYEKLGLWEM